MSRRNVIKAVLVGFLGTWTSRYSEYDGYWIFGFLVPDLVDWEIELLQEPPMDGPNMGPRAFAIHRAVTAFGDQIRKVGLPISSVKQASIRVTTVEIGRPGWVNGVAVTGNVVRFDAAAVSNTGRSYSHTVSRFVCEHDPIRELRSSRARMP